MSDELAVQNECFGGPLDGRGVSMPVSASPQFYIRLPVDLDSEELAQIWPSHPGGRCGKYVARGLWHYEGEE